MRIDGGSSAQQILTPNEIEPDSGTPVSPSMSPKSATPVMPTSRSLPVVQPTWAIDWITPRSARVRIDDDYAVTFGDGPQSFAIERASTGMMTSVSNNLSISVDDMHLGQFAGTVSFSLANGVMVTATTKAVAAAPMKASSIPPSPPSSNLIPTSPGLDRDQGEQMPVADASHNDGSIDGAQSDVEAPLPQAIDAPSDSAAPQEPQIIANPVSEATATLPSVGNSPTIDVALNHPATAFFLSMLTITGGDNALVVSGFTAPEDEPLAITTSVAGAAVDADVRDGLVLVENIAAPGWMREDAPTVAVDAEYLELTAPGQAFDLERLAWSGRETSRFLNIFVGSVTTMLGYRMTDAAQLRFAQDLADDARRSDDARAARDAALWRDISLFETGRQALAR